MSGFTKVFSSMWGGSLYGRFEASAAFLVMLSLANRDGEVDMTPEAIAGATGWPLKFIKKGIAELVQPDKRSRTEGFEGRRLLVIDEHRDWGWTITNYQKYRDEMRSVERREYLREAKRKERERKRQQAVNTVNHVNQVQPIAEAEAEADSRSRQEKNAASPLPFPEGLNLDAWNEWLAYRTERKLPKYRVSSIAKNVKFLVAYQPTEQQAIVDASIRNGYQGLFEPKGNGVGRDHKPRKTRYQEIQEAIANAPTSD